MMPLCWIVLTWLAIGQTRISTESPVQSQPRAVEYAVSQVKRYRNLEPYIRLEAVDLREVQCPVGNGKTLDEEED